MVETPGVGMLTTESKESGAKKCPKCKGERVVWDRESKEYVDCSKCEGKGKVEESKKINEDGEILPEQASGQTVPPPQDLPADPNAAPKTSDGTAWWRTYGVPVIITNTMNNFGEYQQSSKYPVIIQRAIMSGKTLTVHGTPDKVGTRYYIHSRNAADALLYILKKLPPHLHEPGEVDEPSRYNIVGDKQVDNLSLAKIIAKLMGKRLDYEYVDFHSTRPGHDLHYGLDGGKLR